MTYFFFLLSALYNKYLILSLKYYESPPNKFHLTEGVAFIKNISVTITFGVKYMKISTCSKILLSKTRKSMPRKLVPLFYTKVVLHLLYTISECYWFY